MMSKKEKEILEELKKNLQRNLPKAEFWQAGETETDQCVYYLKTLKDNLKKDLNTPEKIGFSKKDTNRNRWGVIPMAALRSSAALIYNILGDGTHCEINVDDLKCLKEQTLISGGYQLQYEWKYKTINRAKANIDAYLNIDNCHLFIEMKMLEPLTKTHPFDSYSSYIGSNCPKVFKDAFELYENNKPEYFDACQMIKHLLAIYNYFNENRPKETQNVVLLNCHWEPLNCRVEGHPLEETYTTFDNFAKEFEKMRDCFQEKLFAKLNVNLVLAHCTHCDLKKMAGKENDKYLERYDIR